MGTTWIQDIVKAFENLGGTANYDELYQELARIRTDLSKNWDSTVRREIQKHSSDSDGFENGDDLFYSVDGLGKGVWGLRSYMGATKDPRVNAASYAHAQRDHPTNPAAGKTAVRLSKLTDRQAVHTAVDEFSRLGRKGFLSKYGFEPSRGYFLQIDDKLFDSKAIVGVAYGIQHPNEGALTPDQFSGGKSGAVRALERLKFQVVTKAQLNPPQLGDEYERRTNLYEEYGGDKYAGITRLPGEDIVNVFADADGPYNDDLPALDKPFGYRGEGLSGPHQLHKGGNALLEKARVEGVAVRFWHRPKKDKFVFLTWVAVVGRRWVQGSDKKGPRLELEWQLHAVSDPSVATWPPRLKELIEESISEISHEVEPVVAKPDATYIQLVNRVEARGQARRPSGVVRNNFARSEDAKNAVLKRSKGKCESPRCTGMPEELNRQGQPILDVDHVIDLALQGIDHPTNMVAICPNCHAAKTRGINAEKWRRDLAKVAKRAHENMISMEESGF